MIFKKANFLLADRNFINVEIITNFKTHLVFILSLEFLIIFKNFDFVVLVLIFLCGFILKKGFEYFHSCEFLLRFDCFKKTKY